MRNSTRSPRHGQGAAPLRFSTSDARARLASDQAALVQTLGGTAALQPGFDARRVRLAGTMLAHKRHREVAKAWPATARALASGFAQAFGAYAEAHPLPSEGGPAADGRAFVRCLPQPLPAAIARERLAYDCTRGGLVVYAAPKVLVVGWRGRVRLWLGRLE